MLTHYGQQRIYRGETFVSTALNVYQVRRKHAECRIMWSDCVGVANRPASHAHPAARHLIPRVWCVHPLGCPVCHRRSQTLDWSSAHARRASWDWKSGPAKVHYLWGLSAFREPHILRFLERFWRYMPQFATVGLVGGFRDDGASGAREEPAGFRRNLRACRLLRYSGPVRRK